MDWAKDGSGNRSPIVAIDGDTSLRVLTWKPQHGTSIRIDASHSSDPDGDNSNYHWWILTAAGTYKMNVEIKSSNESIATITIPADSVGKSFHVIYEITDDGKHNLSGYRSIIVEPSE